MGDAAPQRLLQKRRDHSGAGSAAGGLRPHGQLLQDLPGQAAAGEDGIILARKHNGPFAVTLIAQSAGCKQLCIARPQRLRKRGEAQRLSHPRRSGERRQ